VGDLLKRDAQILPDTYLARGEVVRTLEDGTTQYFSFDVDKALAGDSGQDLVLEDRDRVELYRVEDMRLPKTVKVLGPVTRPGTFAFHEGMRASDLIFRAGVPLKSADRLVAELARTKDGKPSDVLHLDLARLLSTATASPVALLDDAVNPRVLPDDQISLFEKPDFKVHRTVRISGQVVRPGSYVLDTDKPTLSELLKRAGGLTPEAMVQAGIFLRQMGAVDASLQKAALESGVVGSDPTAKGINEILERLNETKRQPLTGQLLKNPLLHGLLAGNLSRMVVNFQSAQKGDAQADVELQDGDEIIIPRRVDAAYVVGEAASPFAVYKVHNGMKVSDLLKLAGGLTRNADASNIRLLKADGRIIDSWVEGKLVEPGDAVLIPQRFRRDTNWQENLQALTPLALILNAIK
jgi:protein involved in polysaccharide export with SLBB domain